MNYYFLTEDSESLLKVLPYWLKYMNFPCSRVQDITKVNENNYVLQSGHGCIQLITCALFQTFNTIIDNNNIINELVIILDAEELQVEDRFAEVTEKINSYENLNQLKCNIKIFVINCCFESWLLCNSSLYPSTPPDKENSFYKFYNYYDIRNNDPEKMEKPKSQFKNTGNSKAKFHFSYFHEMCHYNNKIYYKGNTKFIENKDFFDNIVTRTQNTSHGKSFKMLYEHIMSISQ